MAELADALVSGTSDRKIMQVQVLFSAPQGRSSSLERFGLFLSIMKTMEQEQKKNPVNLRLSVRQFAVLTARTGGLASPIWGVGDPFEGMRANDAFYHLLLAGLDELQSSAAELDCKIYPEFYLRHTKELQADELYFTLTGRADFYWTVGEQAYVAEVKAFQGDEALLPRDAKSEHWAQVQLYAYLLYVTGEVPPDATQVLYVVYQDPNGDQSVRRQKVVTRPQMEAYFDDLLARYLERYFYLERDNQFRRKSFRTAKFPFSLRPGQKEMIHTTFLTLHNKGVSFIQAPTGIGKTLGSLYPAMKAVGIGSVDKVFYATAMTSTRRVVEEAANLLRQNGMKLRALRLMAKEQMCVRPDLFCDLRRCPFATHYFDHVSDALMDLAKHDAIDPALIAKIAQKHLICPYYFSLDVAMFCHLVIGDYNHLFSPNARLNRYLDNDARPVAFLIDEAHNLPARSRTMYSAPLTSHSFLRARQALAVYKPKAFLGQKALLDHLDRFLMLWDQLIAEIPLDEQNLEKNEQFLKTNPLRDDTDSTQWAVLPGFMALQERPVKFLDKLGDLRLQIRAFLDAEQDINSKHPTTELFFDINHFLAIAEDYFADNYVTTLKLYAPKKAMLTLVCLDASQPITESYRGKHPVVFFSATLTPMYYYEEMLNSSRDKDRVTELMLGSPFPPQNRLILAATQYSLRSRDREDNLGQIALLIEKIVQIRTGNTLVFVPSWSYLETLQELYKKIPKRKSRRVLFQRRHLDEKGKQAFLDEFKNYGEQSLLAFTVIGSLFNEGVDLKGEELTTVIVLGTAYPALAPERRLFAEYVEKKHTGQGENFAFHFPGFNRVEQAVGRLIRSEHDKGVAVLIDQRWEEPQYRQLIPEDWNLQYVRSNDELLQRIEDFWHGADQ